MAIRCLIVPPHLLRAIADSEHNTTSVRESARAELAACEARCAHRLASRRTRISSGPSGPSEWPSGFVPPHLLQAIAESDHNDDETRARARRTLVFDERRRRSSSKIANTSSIPAEVEHVAASKEKNKSFRSVYTMHNNDDETALPGKVVRSEGEPKVKDPVVNEAFDNVGTVLDFYKQHFKWHSIDNKNSDIVSTVHFGEAYENAFWDPEKLQMVFGDGGEFLNNFTGCIDVIGHELTHAITEHTSPLDYDGQPGALNEHVSDVFGIMIKQKVQNETSEKADWLIGEDCILPGVKGTALRNMKAPGTAYNDPRFGKDPQVGNMSQYKTTFEDNSGVHIFSGIPNRAFYLTAVAFGGYSWEKAGQIWWKAMLSGQVQPQCTFKQFADITASVARKEFGKDAAHKVRTAWATVGISGPADKQQPGKWCTVL